MLSVSCDCQSQHSVMELLSKRHFKRFVGREGTSKSDVSKIDLDGPPAPDP